MSKQPLFILLICLIVGILAQEILQFSWLWATICLGIGITTLLSFLLKNLIILKLRPLFISILFFSIGVFIHFLNSIPTDLPQIPQEAEIIFSLDKKLNSNEKNKRYEISAFYNGKPFRSILSVPKKEKELDFSHYYQAKVWINKVEPPQNNYQFNYAKYLQRKDIYFQAFAKNSLQKSPKTELSFSEFWKQKRLDVLANIDQTTMSDKVRNFLKSIILADRTELHQEILSDFQQSGLIHLLAISGTHIGIIFGAIFLFLKKVIPLKFNKFTIPISLAFIWFFAFFIGGGNPVIRACTMLTAYFSFQILQRKTDTLHSTSLAGLAILAFDTQQLFDIGFLLSFCSVLGIFWFNQAIINRFPKPKNSIQRIYLYTFSLSTSAQLGTIPLILYHFHQYSLISIIANLAIIPLAQIIIVFSFLMTILLAFNLKIIWLEYIYEYSISIILELIKFFGNIEFGFFQNISFSLSEAFVLSIFIFSLKFLLNNFNLKNILKTTYILLIFISLRLIINFYEYQKFEIKTHHLNQEKIVSVKEKGKVYFYLKQDINNSKTEKYIIQPYLISIRCKEYEIREIPPHTSSIQINGQVLDFK